MPEARTDSETAKKAQALREAAELGCIGAHRHPDGTWMACSTMEEYERLTNGEKEKSALDVVEETQNIRSQKGRRRKRKNKRQWEKLREQGVAGIETLPGGGLVSGKGMTFRPVDGDTDVFDNINQARRRARQLGCIGVARRISRSGRRVWTPCTNMTDYARATGSTALGRRYQRRLERQAIRNIVREELSKLKRRKKSLFEEVYEVKRLGARIGQARRAVQTFDPDAWDGDNDGIVQEGTPWERPAIPGINTNLPGQRHTRQKPSSYPKDKPSRLEGMRSSRPTSPRIMRGRNWDEEPDDDLPPISAPSGRMLPGEDYELERFGRTEDATPDDRPMGTGPGERLPGRDELRRMSGPEFKQWLADEREKIGITDTSHPAYPHPALTHREHFIDTEMVPVEFFDDVPGRDITDPDKLAQLKSEIKTDGFREPIKLYYNPETGVVNLSDGDIYTAAKELGIPNVPVRISTTTRSVDGKEVREGRLVNIDGGKPSQVGIPTEKIPAHTEKLRLMQMTYGGNTSGPARRMRERAEVDFKREVGNGLRSMRNNAEIRSSLAPTVEVGNVRVSENVLMHTSPHMRLRPMLLVELSDGTIQPFYRRSGSGNRSTDSEAISFGGGGGEGQWVPFDGFGRGRHMDWFRKDKYGGGVVDIWPDDPLFRYGTEELKTVGRTLDTSEHVQAMLDSSDRKIALYHIGVDDPDGYSPIDGLNGKRQDEFNEILGMPSHKEYTDQTTVESLENLARERRSKMPQSHDVPQRIGMRSIRQSDAVNAPLDKTALELAETFEYPNGGGPLRPNEPIALQHATRSVEALESLAADRFRLRGEQGSGGRDGLDNSGTGGLFFTFEGEEHGTQWDLENEGLDDDGIVGLDSLVAVQATPKRPITIGYKQLFGEDPQRPRSDEETAAIKESVAEQLGFKTFEELEAYQVKRAKELGIKPKGDIRVSALEEEFGVIPELHGIDLISGDSQGYNVVVTDPDILEIVGVRRIGWGDLDPDPTGDFNRDTSVAGFGTTEGGYGGPYSESNESIRNRINKTIRGSFEDQPSASGGMRSSRTLQRMRETPEANIEEMEFAIDQYLEFIARYPNFDFSKYSAFYPKKERFGRGPIQEETDAWLEELRNLPKAEQDLINQHDELWDEVEEWATFISEAQSERQNLQWNIEDLQEELKEANRRIYSRPRAVDENDMIMAIANGEDRDTYLEREFGPFERSQRDIEDGIDDPSLYVDRFVWEDDLVTYQSYWDEAVERRDEIARIQAEIDELQKDLAKHHVNGSEESQELFREALLAKLAQRPDTKPVQEALTEGRVALDPSQGMRSRRNALSTREKDWLKILQNNPGLWSEVPANVRSVASAKLKNEAREFRMQGMRSSRNVGGRVMGQRILGKVKPEHRNKKDRTLYFVGGTTGAGKSTVIKDGSVNIPGETEAAHIDPDFIKTGLDGWDPSSPGRVHEASRRSTDHIMGDAMNSGMDMVVQGTGKRTEHLREAKKRGYETVGHFVYIPGKEADKRIAQRTEAGGPNIPGHFGSLIAGELRNGIVSRQITNGLYDEFFLWDNTGDTPRLVAFRNKDGHFQINGRQEFDDFFGPSGRYVEKYWQENQ